MGIRGELFSLKLVCEERTYFFNVKENRLGDVFLSVVESKESELSSYERHSIVVFQENLDEFMGQLTKIAGEMRKVKPARPSDKLRARARESGPSDTRNSAARSGDSRGRTDHARGSRPAGRASSGGAAERGSPRSRTSTARSGAPGARESGPAARPRRPVVRARKPADKDSSSES